MGHSQPRKVAMSAPCLKSDPPADAEPLHVRRVERIEDLRAVQAMRYGNLCQRLGLTPSFGAERRLVIGDDDTLETTQHLIACRGSTCLGVVTVRLAEVVDDGGSGMAFEFSRIFELQRRSTQRVAEVCRLCVDRRGAGTLFAIKTALFALAEQHRIDGLVALADLRTDESQRAQRLYELADALGLVAPGGGQQAVPANREPDLTRRLPRGSERLLPPTLRIFSRVFGARVIGPPGQHPNFPRRVLPVFAPVSFNTPFPRAINRK